MTASQHAVRANGLRFRALADGPAGGDLVILLHGFPEGAESWSRQISALARSGKLAVAPDMRGYGGSDAPEGVDQYTIAKLVEDAAALIRSFGKTSAHVVGHDWGALVAWFFAAAHPEMTTRLTVLSVGHPAALAAATMSDEDQKARSRYVGLFLQEGKAESVLAEDDFRRLRAMFGGGVPRAAIDRFVRSLARPGRLTAALNYYRANLSPRDSWGRLSGDLTVTVPTVLLWGDQDPALGRLQAEQTAQHMKAEFELEVLEGAGHWLQFERGDAVTRRLVNGAAK